MAEENKIQQFINAIRASDTLPEGVKSELIEKYESLPKDTVLDKRNFDALEAYENGVLDVEQFTSFLEELTPREVAATDAALKEEMSPEVQEKAAKLEETPDALKPLVRESKKVTAVPPWTRKSVQNDRGFLYVFTDNFDDAEKNTKVSKTQAQIRGEENAIGISTRKSQTKDFVDTPEDFEAFKNHVDEQIALIEADGRPIKVSEGGMATDKAKALPDKFKAYLANAMNNLAGENIYAIDGTVRLEPQVIDEVDRSTIGQADDPYFDTGIARQPDKPNPISTRVDIDDTGPGFSRSGSDAWPVRTGENYLAAAQQGGFTVDFSLQEIGSGATKKANGYLITQIKKIPKYANLSQKEILDKLYKQILVNPDGTFATNKETIEGIANEVRKVLNKGGTINIKVT